MINRHWKEVQDLGDKIGYGELMTVASIIWAAKLIDQGLPDEGPERKRPEGGLPGREDPAESAEEDRLRRIVL